MLHQLRFPVLTLMFSFALLEFAIPHAQAIQDLPRPDNDLKTSIAIDDHQWDGRFGLPGVSGDVNAIAVDGHDVYVGGQFTLAGDVGANHIARWNAKTDQWSALGDGLNGNVYALAAHDGVVYAGGTFTQAGSVHVNHVAKWDSNAWSPLGSGLTNEVFWEDTLALAADAGHVYAGGNFDTAGGKPSFYFAEWSEASRTFLPVLLQSH